MIHALRNNAGLDAGSMQKHSPAIFATAPKPTVSERYRFISTLDVLTSLKTQGFYPVECRQAGTREQANAPYVRHQIRLRHHDLDKKKPLLGELVPEVSLLNGHNGSARYVISLAFYRLVCLNGLVVGDQKYTLSVSHGAKEETIAAVMEASLSMLDFVAEIMPAMRQMMETPVTPRQATAYAELAMGLRWTTTLPTLQAPAILVPARPADAPTTVWGLYNTVQENLLHKEHTGRSSHTGRVTHVGPVQAVGASMDLNRGLWNAAIQLLPQAA